MFHRAIRQMSTLPRYFLERCRTRTNDYTFCKRCSIVCKTESRRRKSESLVSDDRTLSDQLVYRARHRFWLYVFHGWRSPLAWWGRKSGALRVSRPFPLTSIILSRDHLWLTNQLFGTQHWRANYFINQRRRASSWAEETTISCVPVGIEGGETTRRERKKKDGEQKREENGEKKRGCSSPERAIIARNIIPGWI